MNSWRSSKHESPPRRADNGATATLRDDDVREVGPLDAIRVAPTVARAFEAGDGGLELLAFGPRHEGDGEILHEDFWSFEDF